MHIDFNQAEGFEDFSRMADRFGRCIKQAMDDPELADRLRAFGSRFDTGFSPNFGKAAHPSGTDSASPHAPHMNSSKTSDGSLVFQFLLPGFEQSGVDVRFRGDTMFLSAHLPEEPDQERQRTFTHQGFSLKNYERLEYVVPADAYSQNQTKAVMRNGILTLTIPAKNQAEDLDCIRVQIEKEGS
jgi:HSP20 family molecular chaperone IbpA